MELNAKNSGIVRKIPLTEPCLLEFNDKAVVPEDRKAKLKQELQQTRTITARLTGMCGPVEEELSAAQEELNEFVEQQSGLDEAMSQGMLLREKLDRKKRE